MRRPGEGDDQQRPGWLGDAAARRRAMRSGQHDPARTAADQNQRQPDQRGPHRGGRRRQRRTQRRQRQQRRRRRRTRPCRPAGERPAVDAAGRCWRRPASSTPRPRPPPRPRRASPYLGRGCRDRVDERCRVALAPEVAEVVGPDRRSLRRHRIRTQQLGRGPTPTLARSPRTTYAARAIGYSATKRSGSDGTATMANGLPENRKSDTTLETSETMASAALMQSRMPSRTPPASAPQRCGSAGPAGVGGQQLLDAAHGLGVGGEVVAERMRPEDHVGTAGQQGPDDRLPHRQRVEHGLLDVPAPGGRVQHGRVLHLGDRSVAGRTSSTWGRPTIRNFSAGIRTPCVGVAPDRGGSGGEDLVVHRVGRVVRGRLVGVAVAEVDVPELGVADQRAVARGRVDVEAARSDGTTMASRARNERASTTGTSVSRASASAGSPARVTITNGRPVRLRYGSHIVTW